MRITSTGTPNPAHALVVNGEVWSIDGHLTSDERYKKNITPVQNALATLLKIEGVSYEWKKPEEYLDVQAQTVPVDGQVAGNDVGMTTDKPEDLLAGKSKTEIKKFPEGRHYGVLAQAIEKVLPEVVSTDANGDKGVSYSGIIPVLIEVIKEQQKNIEKQQQELAEIRSLVGRLSAANSQ